MKLLFKDFFSNCEQISGYLWIYSYLLKKFNGKFFFHCSDTHCIYKETKWQNVLIKVNTYLSYTSLNRLIYNKLCLIGIDGSIHLA